MITRIVRMSFREDEVATFLQIFDSSKSKIRAIEGCLYLSLHRDASDQCVFYTLSKWTSEASLNQYRESDLFIDTWARTKLLFRDKPMAYSMEEIGQL